MPALLLSARDLSIGMPALPREDHPSPKTTRLKWLLNVHSDAYVDWDRYYDRWRGRAADRPMIFAVSSANDVTLRSVHARDTKQYVNMQPQVWCKCAFETNDNPFYPNFFRTEFYNMMGSFDQREPKTALRAIRAHLLEGIDEAKHLHTPHESFLAHFVTRPPGPADASSESISRDVLFQGNIVGEFVYVFRVDELTGDVDILFEASSEAPEPRKHDPSGALTLAPSHNEWARLWLGQAERVGGKMDYLKSALETLRHTSHHSSLGQEASKRFKALCYRLKQDVDEEAESPFAPSSFSNRTLWTYGNTLCTEDVTMQRLYLSHESVKIPEDDDDRTASMDTTTLAELQRDRTSAHVVLWASKLPFSVLRYVAQSEERFCARMGWPVREGYSLEGPDEFYFVTMRFPTFNVHCGHCKGTYDGVLLSTDLEPDDVLAIKLLASKLKDVPMLVVIGEGNRDKTQLAVSLLAAYGIGSSAKVVQGKKTGTTYPSTMLDVFLEAPSGASFTSATIIDGDAVARTTRFLETHNAPFALLLKPPRELTNIDAALLGKTAAAVYGSFNLESFREGLLPKNNLTRVLWQEGLLSSFKTTLWIERSLSVGRDSTLEPGSKLWDWIAMDAPLLQLIYKWNRQKLIDFEPKVCAITNDPDGLDDLNGPRGLSSPRPCAMASAKKSDHQAGLPSGRGFGAGPGVGRAGPAVRVRGRSSDGRRQRARAADMTETQANPDFDPDLYAFQVTESITTLFGQNDPNNLIEATTAIRSAIEALSDTPNAVGQYETMVPHLSRLDVAIGRIRTITPVGATTARSTLIKVDKKVKVMLSIARCDGRQVGLLRPLPPPPPPFARLAHAKSSARLACRAPLAALPCRR